MISWVLASGMFLGVEQMELMAEWGVKCCSESICIVGEGKRVVVAKREDKIVVAKRGRRRDKVAEGETN